MKPNIVCLTGPAKLWNAFQHASRAETLSGNIVLAPLVQDAPDDIEFDRTGPNRILLRDLQRSNINLADEVLVLNIGCSPDKDTSEDVSYAESLGKRVRYLMPS